MHRSNHEPKLKVMKRLRQTAVESREPYFTPLASWLLFRDTQWLAKIKHSPTAHGPPRGTFRYWQVADVQPRFLLAQTVRRMSITFHV